jgi:hypothetical protein
VAIAPRSGLLRSDWGGGWPAAVPEWTAAIGRDPTGRLGVLLPVRVVDFTPGGLFGVRGWVDLAGKDRQAAQAALLAGCARSA